MNKIYQTNELNSIQSEELMSLWNNEYPNSIAHDSLESFEIYLSTLENQVHFLALESEQICGWGFCFDRNYERWFAIIINRKQQGLGLGAALLNELKKQETELNGWVVIENTSPRTDETPYPLPMNFYLRNGFQITSEKNTSAVFTSQKIVWEK